jgi:hypothetical protein
LRPYVFTFVLSGELTDVLRARSELKPLSNIF